MTRTTQFDTDHSGTINLRELENAVAEYQMDQEIIGATLQGLHSPPPPKVTLTRTRTLAVAFNPHHCRRSPAGRSRHIAVGTSLDVRRAPAHAPPPRHGVPMITLESRSSL